MALLAGIWSSNIVTSAKAEVHERGQVFMDTGFRRYDRIALSNSMRLAATLIAFASVCFIAASARADPYPVAVLQALDKISARVSILEVAIGSSARFGNLVITARHCDKRPPEETPESAAFLEIDEIAPDQSVARRFSGWMFASSPALSAMDHQVYDVLVLDCRNAASSASETSP
jgi:hypothetical protein